MTKSLLAALCSAWLCAAHAGSSANYTNNPESINSGSVSASSASDTMRGTVGQIFATGTSSSTTYSLNSGFWHMGPGASLVQQPVITVSPSPLNFGDVNVGASSALSVTIGNSGTGDLVVGSPAVTGVNASDYSITGNDCGTVAPSGNCTIQVTLTPAATGARTATLSIPSNDPPTKNVSLSGTGIAQTPQTITFGALANRPYPSAPFTVSATGGGSGNPVVFSSLTTGVCTTSGLYGTTVTIHAAGICTIAANQAGGGGYAAAPQVTRSFTVTGIFRAYLSKNGSDANPCTLPQPCRLLPAALTVVNEGGEIWMLDSANFNASTVNVFKSVTILAVPGALGSVVANGADAILIIGSTTIEVTLRNLVILNLSGAGNTGVVFWQGSQLTVEGSEIYGVGVGIHAAAPGGVLTVKDTTIRDNPNAGVYLGASVLASLERVALLNNGQGIYVPGGSPTVISESMISGSGVGVAVGALGATTARLALTSTELSGNGTAVGVSAAAGGDTAQVVLEDTTITHNGTGVALSGAGTKTVFTRQNNALKFNTNDVTGGALTPQGPQ